MTRGEIWKDFFKRTVLPVLIALFLFSMFKNVFTENGEINYFYARDGSCMPFRKLSFLTTSCWKWKFTRKGEAVTSGSISVSYTHLLRKVNDLISGSEKVKESVLMLGDISEIYVNNFGKMLTDKNFSQRELCNSEFSLSFRMNSTLLSALKVS